jgi:hypothetical protein
VTAAIAEYVSDVAWRMRLSDDWDIGVVRHPKLKANGQKAAAGVYVEYSFVGRVNIHLDPKHWKGMTRKQRRHVIVHELVHLHMRPYRYLIGGDDADIGEEIMVERLTQVIASHMPKPGKGVKP